jgi:hypothetical protein
LAYSSLSAFVPSTHFPLLIFLPPISYSSSHRRTIGCCQSNIEKKP